MTGSDAFSAIRRAIYMMPGYDCMCIAADEAHDGKDHKCLLHANRERAEHEVASLKAERDSTNARLSKCERERDALRESEWGACVRCGRQDEHGEFVELMGSPTPDNPDGGTGDPICPTCIRLSECERVLRELRDKAAFAAHLTHSDPEPGEIEFALQTLVKIESSARSFLAESER